MKRQSINKEDNAQNMATLHVEAERSLNFLGDENDDLNASCRDTKQVISRLSTRLSQLSQKVELLAKEIDESREYSYSFNVKFLVIPELKPRESAMEATELCVHIFNSIGANTTIGDTDIAHRVAPRDATGGRPEPVAERIILKFIRRLAREEVMALCRENKKCGYRRYRPASESALTNASTYEHLTPKRQQLLNDAKPFKCRRNFTLDQEFCYLATTTADSYPVKIKDTSDLGKLANKLQHDHDYSLNCPSKR